MDPQQVTVSAAIYVNAAKECRLSTEWVMHACNQFARFHLEPVLFTASGGDFEYDDCWLLTDESERVLLWEEEIHGRRNALMNAIHNRAIVSLTLDSPRVGATSRANCRLTLSASTVPGELYFGLDQEFGVSASRALRHLYELGHDLFDIRYGIAYTMPLASSPACYASGYQGSSSFEEVVWMMRHRREWEQRRKTPDELWCNELYGAQRHLSGLFRGAYPANILSEAHVRAGAIDSCDVGVLTPLNSSLWLWELSDTEIPRAEEMLESRRVLVRQATAT